ncbi:hypothetical protein [Enterobacter cloacae complex sp. 288G10]|uniref:hypothetical protein n=1 Tax=Enterobacter cloacae complex sp. 288G10 TaxID=3395859 RepID=UPI003CEFC92D
MDEAGNSTTKSSRFRDLLNNLIEFNTIKTLAVGVGLKTSDNQPLAYLRTKQHPEERWFADHRSADRHADGP